MTNLGLRETAVLLLALVAMGCLAIGITMPVIKLTRLYFWTDTHSITSIVTALYYTGEYFLAAVIAIFSIGFPVFKIAFIVLIASSRATHIDKRNRWYKRLEWLGKWSMLDVLVLALLVFYAKSTKLADATALPGIYYFSAAVILTMVAYALLDPEAGEATPEVRR